MSQPIVPLKTTQSRQFPHKSRNDMVMKIHLGQLELTLFQSLPQDRLEAILDKVLGYDHPTQ